MTIDAKQIKLVCASEEDLEAASSILIEASNWLIGRGIPLWKPEQFSIDKLRPIAERNELYLAHLEGEYVGAMVFQLEDELFWPNVPPGESAFLHKIAVRRRVAGQGIVKEMIHWAKEKAQNAGRKYLRLDCDGTRPKLCAYYETLGFRRHSQQQIGPYSVARYEISLLPGLE